MKLHRAFFAAGLLGATLALPGCTNSHRVADVEYSGFLEDYARLEKGGRYQAAYRWERPGVDWTQYSKCLLDPVEVWSAKAGKRELTDKEAQELANYLYVKASQALGEHVTMVDQPQPGAIRFEIALTAVGKRDVVMDTVSTVSPIGLAVSAVSQTFTGRAPFTGEAAVEFRVRDAQSGEVLIEGIDRRAGGRSLGKGLTEWSDVYAAMDAWADLIGYRTCVELKRGDCRPPANP